VIEMSPEWVMGPEKGKSSGRIATYNLWTGMFWDGISSIPDETATPVTRSSLPHLWEHGIPREGEDDCWVGEAMVLLVTTYCEIFFLISAWYFDRGWTILSH
jgi:hypothetical protein